MRRNSKNAVLAVSIVAFATASVSINPSVRAADIEKANPANNTTPLNTGAAWVGGVAPGSDDVAVYDSTVTQARSAPMGGDLTWKGIRVTNPGGAQAINGTTGTVNTLTLGSSGIDMSNATADFSIAFPAFTLLRSADQTWSIAAGRTLTFNNGSGSGTNALTLTGPGTVSLANGGSILGTGTLTLSNNVRLLTSNTIIANTVTLNSDVTLGMTNAASQSVYTGGFNINTVAAADTRTIALVNSATTSLTSNPYQFAFNTNGFAGTGTLAFSDGNTATAPATPLAVGLLVDGTISTSGLSVGSNVNLYIKSANKISSTTNVNVDGQLVLGTTAAGQTIASLTGSGAVGVAAAGAKQAPTLTIDGGLSTGSTIFSGVLEDLAGTGGGTTGVLALVKAGASTQILSGANTYTGATTINGGSLLVNGTHIQSTVGSGYTVKAGGTLGGTGLIARNSTTGATMVTVNAGGTFGPGGDGTIHSLVLDEHANTGTGNKALVMAAAVAGPPAVAAAAFSFDLAGDTADSLDVDNYAAGEVTLNNNAVNLQLVGSVAANTYTVDLLRFYGDTGTNLTASGIIGGLTLGTMDPNISAASFDYTSKSGVIELTYTVAPEPASLGIAAVSVLLSMRRRRCGQVSV